ncbi:hypothetical protein ASE95_05775 [Sphingomonas sp. Leaf231]|uniref:hypothetical protein n=1 Tax=Sphingomonas sp. Leaf231 TaxID=1736301 RepID=UPI0006FDC345|nr:hypothetical protein [Sphingomonas sp. Leaf231]KQN94339.1 hypothetical protein ASE95_05775 [Sphingomonas sp. Leaf231]
MTAWRRVSASVIGALFALIAVLGLIALSTWHGSIVHDDASLHMVQVHDAGFDDDADSLIHVAAHSAGHGLAMPSSTTPLPRLTSGGQRWPECLTAMLSGLDPGSILRPPRA